MKYRLSLVLVVPFAIVTSLALAQTLPITDEAQSIFKQHKNSVYQIQVIDLLSGKKSATGSGFFISPEGFLATNYHVVSEAVQEPDQFRVEYVEDGGRVHPLHIRDIDVVHDLAVLKTDQPSTSFLELSEEALSKGARIFALGNPYDLGMTIVEGTYNGLMEKSLYPKILFSGALNSGMSGGPALGHDGRVIGVNASTQGNEISFLVPVDYLRKLFTHVRSLTDSPLAEKSAYIQQQLLEYQDQYILTLLSSSWEKAPLGNFVVPTEVSPAMKCWGRSSDEDKELYKVAYLSCASEDWIYVSPALYTGRINVDYTWIQSKRLNAVRFYNVVQQMYAQAEEYPNAEDKEEVSNFSCQPGAVRLNGKTWRTSLCVRQYKKYPLLYDLGLFMVSLDAGDRSLMVHLNALGLSEDKALDFFRKFMGELK